ncbi:MAG: PQQ-dependent sugar dehydrogenase [Steroidobacteraceae bacterium]|nr:PQQ-dependent sugar dehydrogenase [Steroidobacteraceae bacterium]
MTLRRAAAALALIACAVPALGADANAGRNAFRQQCALCHSAEPTDNGGAQGPELHGVFGRKAASNPAFTYTQALRNSNLTWDAETLDRFLASPTTLVPGSSMVVAVPGKTDRENIIAYFQALKEGTFKPAPPRAFGPPPGGLPPAAAVPEGDADWKKDKPGRVHRVQLASLPAPYATQPARNFPRVVPRPEGALPAVPPGFKVEVFAEKLQGPRVMRVAPNGDIFVSETQSGRVKVLRPTADGSRVASIEVFAQGLNQPHGLQFYPAGPNPQWLYVAETNRVVRYAYKVGDQKATAVPEVVVPQLTPVSGGHFSRDLAFSPDGKRMYVSAGSFTNVAEDMSKKTPEQIKAWEAEHGLGAAWDKEENRAAVLEFDVGSPKSRLFATGLRNCVGLTVQPATGDLWCTVNERDMLGDDLVPDYTTRVKKGAFFGWPWYYIGNHEDPRLKGDRPDLAGKVTVPDVLFTAHSAAVDLTFYTVTSGKSAFPKEYVGDAFAVLHGSWNRAFRTGHKVVRVRMKNNVPVGEYEDFMTGFIVDNGNSWARPAGTVVAQDGSLLVSEDGNNTIYRVSYSR